MNFRSIATSLVLIGVSVLLGACAGSVKKTAVGTYLIAETVGDTADRSMTKYGEYDCPEDKDGKPALGKCKVAANAQPPERAHGQTVVGQAIVGAVGGTGAALVNGNTARAVAKIGQCAVGAVCNGTINNIKVQSVAEALTKVNVKAEAGVNGTTPVVPKPPCAMTTPSTCGN